MKRAAQTELFDKLYRENRARVYRLAFSLAGNPEDAEDITQETFYRAFRFFHTFREESSFFTWIYRIAVNVSNRYMKHRTKTPVQMLSEDLGYPIEKIVDPAPSSSPETEMLAYQIRLRCLHAMTECLPPGQRKVFCLAVVMGLPHKIISEILDLSVGSVKTTLHRARKRWFGYMEDKCGLIDRANPCRCAQFVRFGIEQGIVSRDFKLNVRRRNDEHIKGEVRGLWALHNIYRDLYPEDADERFAERVREGIIRKEWAILS